MEWRLRSVSDLDSAVILGTRDQAPSRRFVIESFSRSRRRLGEQNDYFFAFSSGPALHRRGLER